MGLAHSPKIVTDGLVFCVDAADKKSYSGSGTTWTDRGGNGNNGTLTNGPTFDSANGGSIVFAGDDEYIATNNILELGSSNFSINIIFKSTGTSWQYFTSNKANFNGPFCRTGMELTSGKLRFYLEEDNQSNLVVLSQNAYNDGNWYEVVFVRTGSTGYIYVNGQLENSGTTKSGNVGDSTSNWAIGGGPGDSSGNLIGSISTVKIYNKALTADEVLQNYNATKSRFS